MARVVLVGNLAQLTEGVAEFNLSVTSVKQMFEQLTELHPTLARHLDQGVAVAIDGQIYQDALLESIGPDSEVFLLPQIAGGSTLLLGADGSRQKLLADSPPVPRGGENGETWQERPAARCCVPMRACRCRHGSIPSHIRPAWKRRDGNRQ